MAGKIAIVIGGSGMVGQQLLTQLAASGQYTTIYAITRRQMPEIYGVTPVVVADFSKLKQAVAALDLNAADAFVTLGTTIKQAKSKAAFKQVDYQYAMDFAYSTAQQGAHHLLLLTAMGAHDKSVIFYNRVKGELEKDVMNMGFARVSIFQPALLLGERAEQRLGERIMEQCFKLVDPMLPKYFSLRPVAGARVAKAMVMAGGRLENGKKVYSNKHILQMT